jgi:malate synthase
MQSRKLINNMQVDIDLYDFIENEVFTGLSLDAEHYWQNFSQLITDLMPENSALLEKRLQLQQQISQWHQLNSGDKFNHENYKSFLSDIGYIAAPVDDFTINTSNVDDELATMAGPQLVVPIMNARFALNAVNARWGSLYDALYGSDVINESNGAERGGKYNPARGKKVIDFARDFLDQSIPLASGSHHQAINYQLIQSNLVITLADGKQTQLTTPEKFVAFTGEQAKASALLFVNNGLHFEINFNPESEIAKADSAGISDITLESALTTIMDCEDSVAAVDATDKIIAYKNWLGLNRGDLTEQVTKNGKTITRTMTKDRYYKTPDGEQLTRKGRSLMFVRNVGHLMTNSCILTADGQEVPEGIIDAVLTATIALYDIEKNDQGNKNSQAGSI